MNNWNENEDSEVNNNSFVFYESFYSSMDGLSAAQKEELIWVMCNYAFYEKTGKMSSEIQRMFKLIKPQIDANIKKRQDGNKGGRPSKKTLGYELNKLRLGV